jgi:hypothetical protein
MAKFKSISCEIADTLLSYPLACCPARNADSTPLTKPRATPAALLFSAARPLGRSASAVTTTTHWICGVDGVGSARAWSAGDCAVALRFAFAVRLRLPA